MLSFCVASHFCAGGRALTNSATSFALPLSDSLWTLDLSFSGSADAMVAVLQFCTPSSSGFLAAAVVVVVAACDVDGVVGGGGSDLRC